MKREKQPKPITGVDVEPIRDTKPNPAPSTTMVSIVLVHQVGAKTTIALAGEPHTIDALGVRVGDNLYPWSNIRCAVFG